jgi:hypothetical protein
MKTMIKIAIAFSLVIGLSFSAHAEDAENSTAGSPITFAGSNSGAGLSFTPSGNTLLVAATSSDDYYIGSASDKTTSDNGLEYCMVSGYNGYYQMSQASDGDISDAGTEGANPGGSWTAMGGGS